VAPAAGPSLFERRLARVGRDVRAVTILLEQACGLLRRLVCVAGWLVVLAATAGLLVQPHFGPGHLATPAAGVLAALQGVSPRRAGRRQRPAARPPRGDSQLTASLPQPPRPVRLHSARLVGMRRRSCPTCGHAAPRYSLVTPHGVLRRRDPRRRRVPGHGHQGVSGITGPRPGTAGDERSGGPCRRHPHLALPCRAGRCQRGSRTVSAHPARPWLRWPVSSRSVPVPLPATSQGCGHSGLDLWIAMFAPCLLGCMAVGADNRHPQAAEGGAAIRTPCTPARRAASAARWRGRVRP